MSEPRTLPPDTLPPETRWLTDRYEFLSELGRGGMAVEYRARERESGRPVSVKLVSSRYPGDGDAIRRFAREARTVAGLHHPNIVRTLAIEEREDAVAVVSAYVHGETLRSALSSAGAFTFDEAAAVLRDVAAALAHAHEQGVIHRDVRPENVFLLDGSRRALLSDFGVARSVDALLTSAGASMPTPEYMAPEQADGRPVDARTDVYALGLLGWEMLAGRRPWQGETLHAVLQKQRHEPLPSLATLRPEVPAYLLTAIDGALAKEPSARWRDGADVLTRLTPTQSPVVIREPAVRAAPERMAPEMVAPAEPPLEVPARAALPTDRSVRTLGADGGRARHERTVAVPVVTEPVVTTPAAGTPAVVRETTARETTARETTARETTAREIVDRATPAAVAATSAPPRRRRWPIVAAAGGAALVGLLALMAGGDDDRVASSGNPALDSMRVAASGRGDPATVQGEASGEVRLPAPRSTPAARTPAGAPRPSAVPRGAPPAVSAAAPARAASPNAARDDALRDAAARDARCASAAADDQRTCLLALIEREDVALNNTYGALIAAVRRNGGEDAVRALREQQRAWLLDRDRACRERTPASAEALWGAARVPCFAELSERREAELSARLAREKGTR